MAVKEITSTGNPVVKGIRALAMKKVRDRENLFLAEGRKLATDALAAGWRVRTLCVARDRFDDVGDLAARVNAGGGLVLQCSKKVMEAIGRRDNPQTVMAAVEPRLAPLDAVRPGEGETWVALDRVRDPGNLGTVIRTVDALGASGVVLLGDTTDPFGIDAVRATMGSLFHVPLVRARAEDFAELKGRFAFTVGTHLKGAVDHRRIDWTRTPTLLVMGNEQQGLPPEIADACDALALIAMAGQADSMNLAVSTGIALFEARRHVLPEVAA